MITNDELIRMRENYAHPDNDDVNRLISAYVAKRKAKPTPWQRMDTAPKDGTRIIVWSKIDCCYVPWVYWNTETGEWTSEGVAWGGMPIAWMPQPKRPEWA